MYAGSPSLLVSLWPVSDGATAQLMPVFYEGLNQGLNKAKALQRAKLQYLEQAKGTNAHPFFWAPFVQLGNYETIEIGESEPDGIYLSEDGQHISIVENNGLAVKRYTLGELLELIALSGEQNCGKRGIARGTLRFPGQRKRIVIP